MLGQRCGNSCSSNMQGVCLQSCRAARKANPNLGPVSQCKRLCPRSGVTLDRCVSQCVGARRIQNGCFTFLTSAPVTATGTTSARNGVTTTSSPCIRKRDTNHCVRHCAGRNRPDGCVDLCLTRRMIARGCVVATTTSGAGTTTVATTTTQSAVCARQGAGDEKHCRRVCQNTRGVTNVASCCDSCVARRRQERGCGTTTAAATTATAVATTRASTTSSATAAPTSCVRPEEVSKCETQCRSNRNGAATMDICIDTCLEKLLVGRNCVTTTRTSVASATTTRAAIVDGCFKPSDAAACAKSCARSKSASKCVERCTRRRYAQRGCVWNASTRPAGLTTTSTTRGRRTSRTSGRSSTRSTARRTTRRNGLCNSKADKTHCRSTCFGSGSCERRCLKQRRRACTTTTTTRTSTTTRSTAAVVATTTAAPQTARSLRDSVLNECVTTYMNCKVVCTADDLERAFKAFQSLCSYISKNRQDKKSLRRNKRIRRQVVCLLGRIVAKRNRRVAASIKRIQRQLRRCKKSSCSCRNRALRRLGVARRRETRLLEISRVLVSQSGGAKGKCRRSVRNQLRRARSALARSAAAVARRAVKQSTRIIRGARARLLTCSSKACRRKARKTIRREKRVLRRAKKEQKKVRRAVTKAVVRSSKRLSSLQAKCSPKCSKSVRKAIRVEKRLMRILSGKEKRKTTTRKTTARPAVSRACAARMVDLRTRVLERRRRLRKCGSDRVCVLHCRSIVHSLIAEMASLKGCRPARPGAAGATTKSTGALMVTVKESVSLDLCDDALAEWHVDREKMNRDLSSAYEAAAKCGANTACTTNHLVQLRRLHLALNALKRPECKVVTTLADVTTTTTTTAAPLAAANKY